MGLLIVHVVAAALGLTSGYVALYTRKGGALHRRAGTLFVWTMLVMAAAGTAYAAIRDVAPAVNVPAGVLTAYLVATGRTTLDPAPRWFDVVAMLAALVVGATSLSFGIDAVALGGTRDGIPAFPFFLFGVVGLLGVAGDIRRLRTDAMAGRARIARHLWRMTFALLIAALSFFLGQAKVIPAPLRVPPLLALPIVAVAATLVYWLWHVRSRPPRWS